MLMVAQMISDLYLPLSQVRLEAYRPRGGSDLEMLTNYFWNIDLAEGFVPSLHGIELALRNSIHSAFTARFGTDMWFQQRGLLGTWHMSEFTKAHNRVSMNPPGTAGKLVAELNFGFWTGLLAGPYEQPHWRPNGYALLHAAFPHAATSRKRIYDRLTAIRELRNRIFHHEAIWHRPTLLQEHSNIHQAINWISPTLHRAIHAVDNSPANYHGKANVEARFKALLEMLRNVTTRYLPGSPVRERSCEYARHIWRRG
jgi:hypothetical protein